MCRSLTVLLAGLGLLVAVCDAQNFGTSLWSTSDNGGSGNSDLGDMSSLPSLLPSPTLDLKTPSVNLMDMLKRSSLPVTDDRRAIGDDVPVISMKDAILLPRIPSQASGDILTNQNSGRSFLTNQNSDQSFLTNQNSDQSFLTNQNSDRSFLTNRNSLIADAAPIPFMSSEASIDGTTGTNTQTLATKTFPDQNEKFKFGMIGRSVTRNSNSALRGLSGDNSNKPFIAGTSFQLNSGESLSLPETAESTAFRESNIAFMGSDGNIESNGGMATFGVNSKSAVLDPFSKRGNENFISSDLFGQSQDFQNFHTLKQQPSFSVSEKFEITDLKSQTKQQPSFSVSEKFQDHSKKPTFRVKSQFVDLSPGKLPGMKMIGQFVDTSESTEASESEYATSSGKANNDLLGGIGLPGTVDVDASLAKSPHLTGLGLPGVLEGNRDQQQAIATQSSLGTNNIGFSATNNFVQHSNDVQNTDNQRFDTDQRMPGRTFSGIPDSIDNTAAAAVGVRNSGDMAMAVPSGAVNVRNNGDISRAIPSGENLKVDNLYPPAPFPVSVDSSYDGGVDTDDSSEETAGTTDVINDMNNSGTLSGNTQPSRVQEYDVTGEIGIGTRKSGTQQSNSLQNGNDGDIGTRNLNSGSTQLAKATITRRGNSNADSNNGRSNLPMLPRRGLQTNSNSPNQGAVLRTDPNVQVLNPPNQFINSGNMFTDNQMNQRIPIVNNRDIDTNMRSGNTMNAIPNVLASDRSNMGMRNLDSNMPSADVSNIRNMDGVGANQQLPGNNFRSNIQNTPNGNLDWNANRMNSNPNQFQNAGGAMNSLPTGTVNSVPNRNPNANANVNAGLDTISGAVLDNRNVQINPNGRRFPVQGRILNTGRQSTNPNRAMNGGMDLDVNGNGGRNINGQDSRAFLSTNELVIPGNNPNSGSALVPNGVVNGRRIGNGNIAGNNNNIANANTPTRVTGNEVNNVVPTPGIGNTQAGFDNMNGNVNRNNNLVVDQNGMGIVGTSTGGNRLSNGRINPVSRQTVDGNQFVSNRNRMALPTVNRQLTTNRQPTSNQQPTSNPRSNNQLNNINSQTQSQIPQQQNRLLSIPNSQGTVMTNNQFSGASPFPNAQITATFSRNTNGAVRNNMPMIPAGNPVQVQPGTNIQQLQNQQLMRNGQFAVNNLNVPNVQPNNRQIIGNQRVGVVPSFTANSRGMVPNAGNVQGNGRSFPTGVQTQFGFRGNINSNQNFQSNLQNARVPLSNGGTTFQTGARPFATNTIINSPNGFTQGAVNMNTRMLSGFQDPRMVSSFMPNQRFAGNQFGSNNLGFPRLPF